MIRAGFIGLGNIGKPIAANLAPAGLGLRCVAALPGTREQALEVETPHGTVEIHADVVWRREEPESGLFCYGLRVVAAPEIWFHMWLTWMSQEVGRGESGGEARATLAIDGCV